MKAYKINYHSIIDVITNSSSELFVSTDKKIVELFKSILPEKYLKEVDSMFYTQTFKEFYDKQGLDEVKEDNPEYYNEKYGNLKDDDELLICYYSNEDVDWRLSEFIGHLNFISIY